MKQFGPKSIYLTVDRRLMVVEQNSKKIKLTKDQVNDIRMLRDGVKYTEGVFTSKFPENRFEKIGKNSILATSMESQESITLDNAQIDKIVRFMDKNRPRLAWTRDFSMR